MPLFFHSYAIFRSYGQFVIFKHFLPTGQIGIFLQFSKSTKSMFSILANMSIVYPLLLKNDEIMFETYVLLNEI